MFFSSFLRSLIPRELLLQVPQTRKRYLRREFLAVILRAWEYDLTFANLRENDVISLKLSPLPPFLFHEII